MSQRVYLSNMAPGWPVERQEAVLDERLPGWRSGAIYRDTDLSDRERRGKDPADLVARVSAFRTGTRGTVQDLHVAAFPVIAWGWEDLKRSVLPMMDSSLVALVAVDTGFRLEPRADDATKEAAIAEYAYRRQLGSEEASRLVGARVSADRRMKAAREAADKIRDRWRLPTKDYPTVALLREAGISMNTAIKHLRPRPKVQEEYRRQVEREAKVKIKEIAGMTKRKGSST